MLFIGMRISTCWKKLKMEGWNEIMFVSMIKDLENTRESYGGYSYVRTMRNILTGNKDATIAPFFKDKPYYGIFPYLKLSVLEEVLDSLVREKQIEVMITERGKLYCSHEYYEFLNKKKV